MVPGLRRGGRARTPRDPRSRPGRSCRAVPDRASTRATSTPWRRCGRARSWSSTPSPATSAATGNCGSSSGRARPCWPSAMPRIETVASTSVGGRAVVECSRTWTATGDEISWPVAVVAESPDERSVVFRTYCSQWPVVGRRTVRPPILDAGRLPSRRCGRPVPGCARRRGHRRDREHLRRGRVPPRAIGPDRSTAAPTSCARSSPSASAGGGIGLELCSMTDDGVRCAVEYNCVRWGSDELAAAGGPRWCSNVTGTGCCVARGHAWTLRRRRGARSRSAVARRRRRGDERPPDRRLRVAVGPARRRAGEPRRLRSTGCASRASTARRSSPGCWAKRRAHWSVRASRTPTAVTRRYLDRTMVLETTYRTPTGTAVVVDALADWARATAGTRWADDAPHLLLRQVTCTEGEVEIERRVRPAARVRPRGPAARRGRRRARRDRRGRRPGPVVPAPLARRRFLVRVRHRGPARGRAASASRCTTPGVPTRRRPGSGARPRSRRDWTTPSRRGSRGRTCTRRTTARGASSSTTAAACSRRCRSNRPARSAPRPPRRCPRWSAAPATGTTATPGSGTRRSPSRRCGSRRAPTRPTSSSST